MRPVSRAGPLSQDRKFKVDQQRCGRCGREFIAKSYSRCPYCSDTQTTVVKEDMINKTMNADPSDLKKRW